MNSLVEALQGQEIEEDEEYGTFAEYIYDYNESVETPAGKVKYVDAYRSWPNADPMINVVVEFNGKFYQNSAYYDSWGGESFWDDTDWVEVSKVEVTSYEWKKVK